MKILYGSFNEKKGYFGNGYYFYESNLEYLESKEKYEYLENKNLKILNLNSFNSEWVDLVEINDRENYCLDYDIVIGPVVTENVLYFLDSFLLGTFGKEDLIRMLSYSEVQLQYFFKDKHTAEKCLKEVV